MFNKEKLHFGCAPINWTNDDLPELGGELTYQQCLSEMALAGFTGSEIGNKYPKDLDTLKKALDIRGMRICNAWFSCEFTTKPMEETIENFKKHRDFLHALGAKVIGLAEVGVSIQGYEDVPLFKKAPILTDEQFEKIARGLEELGRLAKEKDMEIAYHYHMGTGIQSLDELDRLMDMTDPQLVPLLFDTGHATFAGEDSVALLEKYVKRVRHVHFKDVRSEVLERVKKEDLSFLQGVKEGIFTVPGDGDMVDWDGVFKILGENNYEGWIVIEAEQDPAKADPLEYAIKARKFIQEKTGI
ncbi:myo-inosose-2 dehydratase [Anaeromicrobium sediminis]|uniref:Inosose dehydratase n=1 Tax=Anaeromicrobium sediminis TaxID=1478221 RepID=A0A267MK73_9FIRM|nr:myo-inosose-2 dehydratase [Anaeromicrobium sediminis]PAB59285.1 myo-inosose-2 dehydratase [Anaeromicrobium sediminis]